MYGWRGIGEVVREVVSRKTMTIRRPILRQGGGGGMWEGERMGESVYASQRMVMIN